MRDISIITTRPTAMRGEPIAVGSVLKLPALDAQALVSNGKAVLRNDADAEAMQAAVQAADFQIARNTPGYMPSIRTKPWD